VTLPVINFVDASCCDDAILEAVVLAEGIPVVHLGEPAGWPENPLPLPPEVVVSPLSPLEQWSLAPPGGLDVLGRLASALAGQLALPSRIDGRGFVARCFSPRAAELIQPYARRTVLRLGADADPGHAYPTLPKDIALVFPQPGPGLSGASACVAWAAGRADLQRRQDLRRRLGLGQDEVVLAAPQIPGRNSGHRQAIWAAAILAYAGYSYRVLMPDAGAVSLRELAFASHARSESLCVLAPPEMGTLDILAAADMAVFLGPLLPPVACLAALAAGLPVIAADSPQARRLGLAQMYVPAQKPRPLAQALLHLRDDPQAAGALVSRGQALLGPHRLEILRPQWQAILEA
jgi:hypothetical protein